MTDERDALELIENLRAWLAAHPNDQRARQELGQLANGLDAQEAAKPRAECLGITHGLLR